MNSIWCFFERSGKRKTREKYGLFLLHPDRSGTSDVPNSEVDIIAVHGLNGDKHKTWTDEESGKLWLKDFIPQKIPKARIFTFGYDAKTTFTRSISRIPDIAQNLLLDISNQRRAPEEERRPIIFVCHSLGGIIVKKALSMARNNSEFNTLSTSVHGIIFLGTPHQGSDAADFGAVISGIAKVASLGFMYRVRSTLVKSLKTNSSELSDISEDFRHLVEHLEKIVSFYETETTPPLNKVIVNQQSAVLNLSSQKETKIPSRADHRTMCKFSDVESPRYNEMLVQIQNMVGGALHTGERAMVLTRDQQKFLKRLQKVNYEGHLHEILRKRCQNTANWILDEQTFRSWKDSLGSSILWLTGDAGTGKTVLSAYLIDTLRQELEQKRSSNDRVIYYFCDGKDQEKIDPVNVLNALLHQVLRRLSCRELEGIPCFTAGDKFFDTNISALATALQGVSKRGPRIFLILDAIDECDQHRQSILQTLSDLADSAACLKLLITSRPGPISEARPGLWFKNQKVSNISLGRDRVTEDIKTYLSEQMEQFTQISISNDDLRAEIVQTILDQAGGIFLWASLAWRVFADYGGMWNRDTVIKRLKELKTLASQENDLSVLYRNILKRLPNGADKFAKKLYKWLITAHRPLTIEETQVVLALEDTHTSMSSVRGNFDLSNDPKDALKRICGHLVTIVTIGASQTIQLVHQSVREFFLSEREGAGPDKPWKFDLNQIQFETSISCLAFLSFNEFSDTSYTDGGQEYEEDFKRLEQYPFLKYAAVYWHHHVQGARVQGDSALELWASFHHWTGTKRNINFCFRIFWYFGGKGEFPRDATPIHILSYFGLEQLVSRLLSEKGSELLNDTKYGRCPLHWAAANGHQSTVKLLLDNGADPRVTGKDGSTPLHLAVEYGHTKTVELLLGNVGDGAHPERGEFGAVLELAAATGHTEIIERFLDLGVDVNVRTENYGTALQAAAFEGHKPAVELLLDRGAKVNADGGKHGNALQAAAFDGNWEIVNLLLKSGADVNAQGGVYGTALQAAAYQGNERVVRRLLESNADPALEAGEHGSALGAAEFAGHHHIVRLLQAYRTVPNRRTTTRRPSQLDAGTRHELELLDKAVRGGRFPAVQKRGLEKRADKAISEFYQALEVRNSRALDVLVEIATAIFKMAVNIGREGFLEYLVKAGIGLMQKAVNTKYDEAVEKLSKAWTAALIYTLKQGKSSLVQRLIHLCLVHFKDVLAKDNGEEPAAAEDVLHASVSFYLAIIEAENEELVDIGTRMWMETLECALEGSFQKRALTVLGSYGEDCATAVAKGLRRRSLVMKACSVVLVAAVDGNHSIVATHFGGIFLQVLRKVIHPAIGTEYERTSFSTGQQEFVLREDLLKAGAKLCDAAQTNEELQVEVGTTMDMIESALKDSKRARELEAWIEELMRKHTEDSQEGKERLMHILGGVQEIISRRGGFELLLGSSHRVLAGIS